MRSVTLANDVSHEFVHLGSAAQHGVYDGCLDHSKGGLATEPVFTKKGTRRPTSTTGTRAATMTAICHPSIFFLSGLFFFAEE